MKKTKQTNFYNNKKHSIKISTFINSTPSIIFKAITNLQLLNLFFPMYVFYSDKKILNEIGQEYTAKLNHLITEKYKVIALEKNSMLSAKLISSNLIFRGLAYIHKLIPTKKGTISEETVTYNVKYGMLGEILNFLIIVPLLKYYIKKARNKLKVYCESQNELTN